MEVLIANYRYWSWVISVFVGIRYTPKLLLHAIFSIVLSSSKLVISSFVYFPVFFFNYMRRGLQFAISLLQLHLSSFSIILLHNSCNLTGSESVILSSLRPFFACIHSFFSFFITIFLASSSRLSLSFNSLTSQQRRPLIRIRACISAPWLALLFAHKSKPTLAITHFYAQPTPSVGDSAIHPSFWWLRRVTSLSHALIKEGARI